MMWLLFVACLMFQHHASVSQGWEMCGDVYVCAVSVPLSLLVSLSLEVFLSCWPGLCEAALEAKCKTPTLRGAGKGLTSAFPG